MAPQSSTRPSDDVEQKRMELTSEARDDRSRHSSSAADRHLIEENESLKAELKLLEARLRAQQQTEQHLLHKPPLRRTLSLKTRQSTEARFKFFSSPPRNTAAQHGNRGSTGKMTTGGHQPAKQYAFQKINRHPSDTNDNGPQHKSEDTDKHGSGRGLKHRRHHSPGGTPGTTHHDRPRPSPSSAPWTPEGRRALPFVDPSNENRNHYDSERASLLEDAVASPPLNRTISSGSTGSKSSNRMHNHEHGATSKHHHHQQHPPQHSFFSAVADRAGWLVGLLILQSMSSFIISRNEKLLQQHLVIVRFLTMLVGAGGNAGNQASVGVIRGLATGAVNDHNLKDTLIRELQMGLALSFLLGLAGAARAAIFMTPFTETLAITTSLVAIVFISVLLGAILPLLMKFCKIDPAHSSTTIQVIMDILGVSITVYASGIILDSAVKNVVSDHN